MNPNRTKISKYIYFFTAYSVFINTIPLNEGSIVAFVLGKIMLCFRGLLILLELTINYKRYNFSKICNLLILSLITIMSYKYTENWIFFDIFFIVICFGDKIDVNKLSKSVFNTILFVLITVSVLNFFGVISDEYVFCRPDGTIRPTLGFSHPNALAGNIFFLLVFYFLKNKEQTYKYMDILIVVFCAIFTYVVPNSITSSFCILIIAWYILMSRINALNLLRRFFINTKILFTIIIFIIIGIILLIYMIALNRTGEALIVNMSGTFYTRFIYGAKALRTYGISIWGQAVNMCNEKQLQLVMDPIEKTEYFNLDCLYFYMPIVLGIIPTLYYCFWWIKALKNASIRRDFRYIVFFVIILAYSVSEGTVLNYTMPLILYGLCGNLETTYKNSRKATIKNI